MFCFFLHVLYLRSDGDAQSELTRRWEECLHSVPLCSSMQILCSPCSTQSLHFEHYNDSKEVAFYQKITAMLYKFLSGRGGVKQARLAIWQAAGIKKRTNHWDSIQVTMTNTQSVKQEQRRFIRWVSEQGGWNTFVFLPVETWVLTQPDGWCWCCLDSSIRGS